MKILKVLMLLLISTIFCLPSKACGGWEEYETYFRLFKPKYMIAGQEFASITFNDEPWSNISVWYPQQNEHDENLKLWKAYFPVSFDDQELKQFIYKLSEDDLKKARNNPSQANNEVLQWVLVNDTQIFDYLLFAKECEQHCNPRFVYYWEELKEKDLTVYNQVIAKGKAMFESSSNLFLKERLGFQLVKLMRHAEKYDECLAFWNTKLAKNEKSIMYYWTLDHIAGVQIIKGLAAEGRKNFIEVFLNSPGKRFSSYCSVKIDTDEEWHELLNACDTDKQKESMYFMRASQLGSVALADIDSLYQINPKSEYLPILICREINKIESIYLQNKEAENVFYQLYFNKSNINQELSDYLQKFNRFLSKCIDEKQIKNIDFWRISYLYTNFLIQDFDGVREQMALLSKNIPKAFKNQLDIIENLLLITDKSKNPIQRQNEMKSTWNVEVKDFAYFFMSHPSNKLPYPLNVDERMYDLRTELDTEKLKALVDLADNQDQLTWFAGYILKNHFSTNSEYLKEMLGTSYLADNENDLAVDVLSELSEEYKASSQTFYLSANPFNYLINDRDDELLKPVKYSKLKLAQTLYAINTAIKEERATAMDYYLLGNAQYNTSYFGYAWNAKAYYWSGGYYTGSFDCTDAYQNFLKAAKMSDDKEMKAKCYYLAAKANQNKYLTDNRENLYWKSDLKEEDMQNRGYRDEFLKLKEEYKDTEFYERIIEECKYFQFYVN
ncbi:hypothetical protein [Marinifilum flexuosum]|uniref:Sel1 repeat-containing protein n=1 Tax=Marinifilum flexuosum TaxID=1117708 RepID=A0A419WT73_9BACT|nr:hypothetical protein [Marinifilum flexuosum]RKD98598.1 hypothetical protein BXY64_3457 [Marinifilum flexuosum]